MDHEPESSAFDPRSITRPEPQLWTYYIIVSLLTTVGAIVLAPILYFRYHTLKYAFDDKGVSMSWGILFHREIYLTYRRIQDIHVSRNFIQRWLKLANVSVQTASGSSGAEMTIEGVRDPEALRDYLYEQMRGARGEPSEETPTDEAVTTVDSDDEALVLLREIRDALQPQGSKENGGAS